MEESEVKVVLLGQSAVGKTCIVNHLLTGKFDDSVSPTLGASYASKTLDINGQKVGIQHEKKDFVCSHQFIIDLLKQQF